MVYHGPSNMALGYFEAQGRTRFDYCINWHYTMVEVYHFRIQYIEKLSLVYGSLHVHDTKLCVSLLGHVSKIVSILLSRLSDCPNTDTWLCYFMNSYSTEHSQPHMRVSDNVSIRRIVLRLSRSYICIASA